MFGRKQMSGCSLIITHYLLKGQSSRKAKINAPVLFGTGVKRFLTRLTDLQGGATMSRIYTVKEYRQALEEREHLQQRFEDKKANELPENRRPLKRRLAKIESAIATFAMFAGMPAVSKGKPEYSWRRARRCGVTLAKTGVSRAKT